MKDVSEILLYGESLGLGENIRVVCPMCGGGQSGEKSLSITRAEDGTLLWNCFRASCTSTEGRSTRPPTRPIAVKNRGTQRLWDGQTEPLPEQAREYIKEKWGLVDPPYWYWTQEYGGRIAMSIRSPKFTHRGWLLRSINPNSQTKALTYLREGEEGLSWHKEHPGAPTILVEDIPSAVRAAARINSVALLGTGIGSARAAEIAQYATRPIVIALDQDATQLSFKWARKWSLLWGDVKVLPLKKDLKNMKEEELEQCIRNI